MPQHFFLSFGFPQMLAIAAAAAGLGILAAAKSTRLHRMAGRVFAIFALLAFGSGVLRYASTSSILSLLAIYLLLTGWRLIYTRENGPNWKDLVLLLCAVPPTLLFLPVVLSDLGDNELLVPWLFYGAFVGMCVALAYDGVRWFFPLRWHAALWRYDHIVRMNLALSGVISAVVLSTVLFHLSWVLPAVWLAALGAIAWFVTRLRAQTG